MSFKSSGYKSVDATVVSDWAKQPLKEPIMDRKAVAYGWIVKAKPAGMGISSVMKTNEDGELIIDQLALEPIIATAVDALMAFYNKYNTPVNRSVVTSNAYVQDIRVPTRPRSDTLFYVLVDARAFDNIPELGTYALQLTGDNATLHTLAEDYLGYFLNNDRSDMGHRERIGSILKANNIDLETADEKVINTWIATVNGDPTRNVSFNAEAQINLPVISMPEPPSPAFIISLEIGEIPAMIAKSNINLDAYRKKIKDFVASFGKVENLNLEEQIELMNKFYPALRSHIAFNDIEMKNVLNDEVEIFLNEDYEVIWVALNVAGEKIPLLKALPILSSVAPFNNMRTMALLSEIKMLSNIGTNTLVKVQALELYSPKMPWEEFVKKYIVPPVVISGGVEEGKLLDHLLETNSVVAGLVQKFQSDAYKTNKDLEKEDEVLANPQIIGAAAAQEEEVSTFNGDVIISNLGRISEKIGGYAKESGQRVIDGTYSEVLNRISVDKLIKITIDCLKKLLDCGEIIEGILGKNLMLGYSTFKLKLPTEAQYMADRALEIAQTGNFTLYGGAYSEANVSTPTIDAASVSAGATVLTAGLLGPTNKKETGVRFLTVLKYGLKAETTVDYDRLLDEVCASLANLEELLDIFKIPTMMFPDDLPVVDLQGAIVTLLEAAIIELLVGLIVGMVQALLDEMLWWCKEDTEATPLDTDYGSSDLLDSISDKVGAGSIASLLSDFYDSLGDDPPDVVMGNVIVDPLANTMGTCTLPDGRVVGLTKSECVQAGGSWARQQADAATSFMDLGTDASSSMSNKELREDMARKCSLIKKLLKDLSVILTPAEITALFAGNSSPVVLDTIVDVIQLRHPELYVKVHTREQVTVMFNKLEKMADIGSILSQINTISRGLGCTFESNCIRDELRKDNFPGQVPPEDVVDRLLTLLDDPLSDLKSPDTFCEEKGSNIDKGLIPKDSASLLFLLDKVIGVMYDGIYMAYDSEIMRIPDALSVTQQRDKFVSRTTLQGASIDFDIFNFFKMQEENFTIEFPDWLPKRTVINPEFQRLVSQGYIPPDGDPQGQFGPYTTEKLKIAGILPTPFNSAPLPGITVPEKYFIFAADSKYGLKKINKLRMGSESESMYFALTEPYREGGQFKPSTFSLKFTLNPAQDSNDYRNTFILQIGDIPVDPSTIPMGGNLPSGQLVPSISFAPFASAIYRSRLAGVTNIDPQAEKVIERLQNMTGNKLITAGSVPQPQVLSGFVNAIAENGGSNASSSIKDFVYKKMYTDLLLQIMSGIGNETLNSPLFKKTGGDKTPFIKIIDWAPVPTDEQRECAFDPHILSLDTVKKRTREAYEQYIKCSPLEDEIAVAGLGRTGLSALEAAGMTGCVMTTLRAYALEQLLRSMYPVSVFAGEEFITKLTVEYVIEETLRGIKKVGQAYYDAFLDQVEFIFGLRMKEFNPFGSVPDILAQSAEIGINWMYADAAVKEYNGVPSGEEVTMEEFESATAGTESCDEDVAGSITAVESKRSSKEQMVRSRIRFLAEEQLYSVLPKLQDLICLNGTLTFDNNFLNRGLPLFGAQKEKGEVRFAKIFENLETMEEQELQRQYGDYLKRFQEWEDNRLGDLLGAGIDTIVDVASTVGTSVSCIIGAFSPPPLAEGEEDISFLEDPLGASGQVFDSMIGGAAKLATGETFEQLGTCVDEATGGGPNSPGLVGTAKNALEVISDSPPPLEDFGVGLQEGATDRFGNLETFERGSHKGKFALTDANGAVVLEKYIKVRKKGAPPPDLQFEDLNLGQESTESETIGSPINESIVPPPIEEGSINILPPANNPLDTASPGTIRSFGGKTESGLSIAQVLCPREVEDTSDRFSTPFTDNPEGRGDPTGTTSLIPTIDPEFEQIYNIDEWQEIFQNGTDAQNFSDVYESWSFGVRMIYVAPTNDFTEVAPGSQPGSAPPTLKVPGQAGFDPNPDVVLFNDITVDASRSYRQFERIEVDRKELAYDYQFPGAMANAGGTWDSIISGPEVAARDAALGSIQTYESQNRHVDASDSLGSLFNAMGSGDIPFTPFPQRDSLLTTQQLRAQWSTNQVFEKVTMERALTIFPLSEVEIPLPIPKDARLSDVLPLLDVGPARGNATLDILWRNKYMSKLMNNLKDSPAYKLVYKYCAPAPTLLSFGSIYANLLNEMPETFFDGTKAELKTLFEILLNGGDYTFENETEKKRGGNREQSAHAQSNMGTTGDARKPGLFDLALQTPKLIFKGLAEFLDPVIAPAAVIVKAGKAGKLLPKFMKKLDDAGEETEENFLLEVTVGPYDLPPPMGKFSLPLPEWLQPDGYVPPVEGLSNDPSENISFELPVFSFKDAITGASLDPFLREKVFKLKSGNTSEKDLFYELSKAIAKFDMITVISIVVRIYIESMTDDKCAEFMIKDGNGTPIIPVPIPIYPGDKLDLPITPVALSSLPMDMLAGYGPGPPHTPLGYIYHGIVAAESLEFPDMKTKERQRKKAGMENKKKPKEKLCIDIDLIRDEEDRRRG